MRSSSAITCAFVLLASVTAIRDASGQAPCSASKILADSARDEVLAVLSSDGELVQEIRQEQGIAGPRDLAPISLVRDRAVCARLAGQFNHIIAPGIGFVVLRVGRLYYAREPDQRLGTGVLTDSAFHVIARFGASLPSVAPSVAPAGARRP